MLAHSQTIVDQGEKKGGALRLSFVAEDVFHGFIAVAPSKIHSGPLQL